METKVARINENGFKQIEAQLAQYHKQEFFDKDMLQAWATDCEDHFMDHGECYAEIQSWESKSGNPVSITISEDGFDVETISAD